MNLSLKNKLSYIIMGIGTTILMLSISIYAVFDIVGMKKNKIRDVNVLAKIIAENNQAALLFNDTLAAKESLYTLIANKDIEYVCILDKNNVVFSESNFTNTAIIPLKSKNELGEKSNLIEALYDINFHGERLGSLYIRSNLNQVNEQIRLAIIIGLSIFLLAIIATYILTFVIQRIITYPILKLASLSALISDNKDYTHKINIKRNDEIGVLINSFNNMIGEIGKQNVELVNAKTKAESSSKAKEQFLANMSHEIRTPINGIDGMAKLLENTKLTDDQKEYLSAIRTSSDNLLIIINDILDVSKIEAGKLNVEKISFNLKENIAQAIKSLNYKAEEKGILLDFNIDENISEILIGDPTRISQIIINLVSNAIKFTSEGSVKINCKLVKKAENSNKIKFEVVDTGIGIAKEKLITVFESFSQEDDSITRKFGGTGLGLSISKQLVELFKGNLKVKSKKGKGTTFYFTIELPIGSLNDLLKDEKVVQWDLLENKKVLLVEDNKINQFLVTTILKKWKIKIEAVENGLMAIEKLKHRSYDIVLMDMQMPVMGGVEATSIIRDELNLTIPIIALTANAIKGDNDKCIEAGMNDYISKPFKHSELFNKILNLVGEQKLYNLDKLNKMNEEGFTDKMVNLFLTEIPLELADIEKGLIEKDYQSVIAVAHKIKPSIDYTCVKSLLKEVKQVEAWSESDGIMIEKTTQFIERMKVVLRQLEDIK